MFEPKLVLGLSSRAFKDSYMCGRTVKLYCTVEVTTCVKQAHSQKKMEEKYSVVLVLPIFRGVLLYEETLLDYVVHSEYLARRGHT
jgi:hypothetical protein